MDNLWPRFMDLKPPAIQSDIKLADYTTLKIGGLAKYFTVVKSMEELQAAINWAAEKSVATLVLGSGSNVLISDQGFDGLVMIMAIETMDWHDQGVTVGAGVKIGQLISGALSRGLGGLSMLTGIPGTVGGAVCGNAGGQTQWIGERVVWVESMDQRGQLNRLEQAACSFGYRSSIFQKNQQIITGINIRLLSVDQNEEKEKITELSTTKGNNQPLGQPTAGCVFKNPLVAQDKLPEKLRPDVNSDGTISAWRLIADAGLTGQKVGQLQLSEKHANFMVNLGGGTADQAIQLISLVKQRVRDTLGVQLQEEIKYIGF